METNNVSQTIEIKNTIGSLSEENSLQYVRLCMYRNGLWCKNFDNTSSEFRKMTGSVKDILNNEDFEEEHRLTDKKQLIKEPTNYIICGLMKDGMLIAKTFIFLDGYGAIPNKRIFLLGLGVKKDFQNQGFGSMFMLFLINNFQPKQIALNVELDNKVAIHFYDKFGFSIEKANCENPNVPCNTTGIYNTMVY